jgi:hypothetical protein
MGLLLYFPGTSLLEKYPYIPKNILHTREPTTQIKISCMLITREK